MWYVEEMGGEIDCFGMTKVAEQQGQKITVGGDPTISLHFHCLTLRETPKADIYVELLV